VTLVDDSPGSRTRRAGAWGLVFVVLLLIGAGMATVPGGDDPVGKVRRFYQAHASVVLLSQCVELVATVPLVLFLSGVAASTLVRSRRGALVAGGALVGASLLTLVPPLLLVWMHDRASASEVRTLAVLSDLSDVLLFAAIAGFAVVCCWAGEGPVWLRWLGLVVAVAAVLRAVEIVLGGGLLAVLAPLGFIVLVVALSVLLLRRAAVAGDRAPGNVNRERRARSRRGGGAARR
jgi:hypothetical protein